MADKKTLSFRIPADTYDEVIQYHEDRDISKSEGSRRLIERGLSGDEDSASRFEFWTRLNEALFAAVMALVVGSIAAVSLAAATGFTPAARWGIFAMQVSLAGAIALGGTIIQQARVRRREEDIAFRDQLREVASLYTADRSQEAVET